MWSAVPGVDDVSSGSGSDEEKSVNFADESPKTSTRDACDACDADASNASFVIAPPRDVCKQHWQTFCKLKRRREESLQSESPGRLKKQKKKCQAVSSSPSMSFPQRRGGLNTDDNHIKSRLLPDAESPGAESPGPAKESSHTQEQQEHWDTLKKHLTVNDHIYQGIDHGRYKPHKSGLQKELDKAVEEGKFDQAEELSNHLATRDLACKIAKSADVRDYLKWKQVEETRRKAKRKKRKLNWGFEAKERWQMKGNM